jgi:hypothetical protein
VEAVREEATASLAALAVETGGDGWGEEGTGWEDEGEWGSLEPPLLPEKVAEPALLDWGAGLNQVRS